MGRSFIIIICKIVFPAPVVSRDETAALCARARDFYIALDVAVVVRVAVGLVVPHVDVHEVVLALHRPQVVGADLGAPEQLDRLDPGAAWEFPMEKKGVEAVCWFCGCPVGRLLALAALAAGADGVGAVRAGLDAGTVAQHLGVGAPRACDAVVMVEADGAIVPSDAPGALAGVAGLVDPVGAGEGGAALPAVVARCVFDEAVEAGAVGVAPVVARPEEGAAEAPGAVGAVLVGAEGAELAGRRGHVVVRALAAVAHVGTNDAAILALKGCEAAPFEAADPE